MVWIFWIVYPIIVFHGLGLAIIMEVWVRSKTWGMEHFPLFLFIGLFWEIILPIMWLITIYRVRKYSLSDKQIDKLRRKQK